MQKKLTITLDPQVYRGLHTNIGKGRISKFIEELVRPYTEQDLEAGYKALAQNEEAGEEALEWSEGLIQDFDDET